MVQLFTLMRILVRVVNLLERSSAVRLAVTDPGSRDALLRGGTLELTRPTHPRYCNKSQKNLIFENQEIKSFLHEIGLKSI